MPTLAPLIDTPRTPPPAAGAAVTGLAAQSGFASLLDQLGQSTSTPAAMPEPVLSTPSSPQLSATQASSPEGTPTPVLAGSALPQQDLSNPVNDAIPSPASRPAMIAKDAIDYMSKRKATPKPDALDDKAPIAAQTSIPALPAPEQVPVPTLVQTPVRIAASVTETVVASSPVSDHASSQAPQKTVLAPSRAIDLKSPALPSSTLASLPLPSNEAQRTAMPGPTSLPTSAVHAGSVADTVPAQTPNATFPETVVSADQDSSPVPPQPANAGLPATKVSADQDSSAALTARLTAGPSRFATAPVDAGQVPDNDAPESTDETETDAAPNKIPPTTTLATNAGISGLPPSTAPIATAPAASASPAPTAPIRRGDPSTSPRQESSQPSAAAPTAKVAVEAASGPLSESATVVSPPPPTASPITSAFIAAPTTPHPIPQQPSPATPAAQIAKALVEPVTVVLSNPAQATASHPHVTTIQITPVELGRVEIRIERPIDGPAKIELVAERPETLSRLVHDQSQLHQALDQAGLTASGRTIEFSLAPPPASSAPASSSLAGGDFSGQNTAGNGSQRQGGRYPNQSFAFSDEAAAASSPSAYSLRSGIDITA